MNEYSVHGKLPQTTPVVVAGMTLTDDSRGTHMTGLGGLAPDFASFNHHIAFSVEDNKSSRKRKRRLEKEMLLEQQETDENGLVSEISLSSDMGGSSLKDRGREMVTSPPTGTCLSHGFASVIGRRREMEDAVTIELRFLTIDNARDYDFFGVYDGHGGSRVAKSCQGRLHHLLVEECKKRSSYLGEEVWSKIMMDCFLKMDEEVINSDNVTIPSKTESHSPTIGSTAVVAVVGEDEVVIANCGDSRAVLCRGGGIPLSISNDHKPNRPDELERIESAGGKVIDWDGHRVFGVLATSRSIGDQYLQPFVIAEPEVILIKRSEADEFLILATDGLWDVVTNEMACLAVKRCLGGRSSKKKMRSVVAIQEEEEEEKKEEEGRKSKVECVKKKKTATYGRAEAAAGMLVDLAISRGSKDNISVVVVDLNKARRQKAKTKLVI